MNYTEWYVAGLYDLLENGGTQEDVEKLVAEVNNPTLEGFKKFLEPQHTVPCGACGEPYIIADDDPRLDKEMLCPDCKKTTSPT